MNDQKTEAQYIYEKGRESAGVETVELVGVPYALVPRDCDLVSLEKNLPAPRRIIASPEFHDVDGFADYVEQFREVGTRIFVDAKSMRFTTVFDCHAPGKPAWGDHSASLVFCLSSEWERFKKLDGKRMNNREFAEFIEDHVAYIKNDKLTGADLLTMAQNLKVQFKGELAVEETLHAGLRNLTIRDDSTLKAQKGDKLIAFPEKLKLALRVFRGDTAFSIEVFVRYRTENNTLVFWIKIPDAEAIQEAAFDQATARIKQKTGLPVLLGTYYGQSHKSR